MRRSVCRVNSRSLIKKRCASPPTSRFGLSTSKDGYICGQTQMRTLPGGGSRGSGRGNNEIEHTQVVKGGRGQRPCLGRSRRLRTPAFDAGSDRRDTRGCSERQSPGFDRELAEVRTLRPRRLTRRQTGKLPRSQPQGVLPRRRPTSRASTMPTTTIYEGRSALR